jgi:PIN domain
LSLLFWKKITFARQFSPFLLSNDQHIMNTPVRRYIFVDFDTLIRIKFKKIEKICDKVFVFISEEVTMIPFALVKDMQKMGNQVKWVSLSMADLADTEDMNYHICFFMGKLHEKIAGDIEFAVLSNDVTLDPLVRFINGSGRNCIRVKPNIVLDDVPDAAKDESEHVQHPISTHSSAAPTETETNGFITGSLIDNTARETIRRLIRSGTRPTEVDDLKKYILSNHQEIGMNGNLEKIIRRLESSGDIVLKEDEVVYNF